AADPTARAGDERDFAVECVHGASFTARHASYVMVLLTGSAVDIVERRFLSDTTATLVGDGYQQELDNARQQRQAMFRNLGAKRMTYLVVPVATLTRGSQRIFIEACPLSPCSTAIPFSNVCADRSEGSVELIGQGAGTAIPTQPDDVVPSDVGCVQRQAVHPEPPQHVARDRCWYRTFPFPVVHSP